MLTQSWFRLGKSSIKWTKVFVNFRGFSRKTNTSEGPYVTIKSKRETKENSKLVKLDPSFELLTSSSGFPFILPGNVGLSWYDPVTTSQSRYDIIMEQIDEDDYQTRNIICRVQTCPTVLRKSVGDLFPYRDFDSSELSVLTVLLKPNLKLMRKNQEVETERLAQTFVLTAKNICDKLIRSGHWADFINPFSGRSYLNPNSGGKLFEADSRFRCLDFEIFSIQECTIVSNEQESNQRRFIGHYYKEESQCDSFV